MDKEAEAPHEGQYTIEWCCVEASSGVFDAIGWVWSYISGGVNVVEEMGGWAAGRLSFEAEFCKCWIW